MPIEPLLAASRATPTFKDAVRAYREATHSPLIEVDPFTPPVKVLRVIAQLLHAEPSLELERVRVEGLSGCSDFRGVLHAQVAGMARRFRFVWCCRWRAVEQGWVDAFGFPDQIRAAQHFGWRCFREWEPIASALE